MSAEMTVEQVDEAARAWIDNSYRCNDARSLRADLVTAYRAGFAAGLGHARKVFMGESSGSYEFLSADGSWKACRSANDAAMWAADGFKVREVRA